MIPLTTLLAPMRFIARAEAVRLLQDMEAAIRREIRELKANPTDFGSCSCSRCAENRLEDQAKRQSKRADLAVRANLICAMLATSRKRLHGRWATQALETKRTQLQAQADYLEYHGPNWTLDFVWMPTLQPLRPDPDPQRRYTFYEIWAPLVCHRDPAVREAEYRLGGIPGPRLNPYDRNRRVWHSF